jgi:hypothetical protein
MPERESYAARLFWAVLVPLAVAIVVLLVEYRSGLFQPLTQTEAAPLGLIRSIVISLMVIATLLLAIQCLLIWFRPYRNTREEFAVVAFCVIGTASAVFFLSLATGLPPWSAVKASVFATLGRTATRSDTRWADYAFLALLYIMVVWWILQSHRKWSGLRSVDQYQRDQRNEPVSLTREALRELRRMVRRTAPLEIYSEHGAQDFITQLEPVSDSLAWRDQARELVRLSSSSYSFDAETDWHGNEGCWIGTNVNTGEMVALFPRQDEMTVEEFEKGLRYAKNIAIKKELSLGEVIVATRYETERITTETTGVLVTNVYEAELLDRLIDFDDYFNEIRKRVTVHKLPDSDLTLADVYVPSEFSLSETAKSDVTVEEYLNEWMDDPSQRQLALLGEYGQGKSTATLLWAYHQISSSVHPLRRIPLVIELRGTSPRNLTPLALFGAWASKYTINPQALMRLLVAGRLTLIFEGFDEMALIGDAAMRLNHFRTLWQFAYPKAKILITGRPNFFLDEEEMKAALGISKPVGGNPYCQSMRLEPFNPEQIKEALRTYSADVRDQIHGLVLTNERFKDIVSRPSLLHIVAVLWEREKLFEKVEQLTSAFVMDLFVRQSYRRQGLKDKDFPGLMALTSSEREYFMLGIASFMASHQMPNQITGRQLTLATKNLLAAIPDSVSTKAPIISGETNQPLRDRIENSEFALEHIMTDVRACGLLVDDPSSPGTFRFGHKSFMEYLFAAVVAEYVENPASEEARAVLSATSAGIQNTLSLPVAIEFLSELLVSFRTAKWGPDDPSKLARQLLNIILGDGVLGQLRSFFAFNELLTHSIAILLARNEKSRLSAMRQRITRILMGITMLIFTLPLVPVFLDLSNATSLVRHPLIKWLLPLFMLMIFTVFFMTSTAGRPFEGPLELWLRLCRGMGIDEKSLHRAAGTWFIPKINEVSFYSYLEEDRKEVPSGEIKHDGT